METAETMPERNDQATNRAAAQRLMKGMRERDYETIADSLAPDVVINSPITDSFRFHGRDNAVALLRIVREAMNDLEHYELLGAEDVWTHRLRFRVRGRLLEGMDLMRFDETGHVRELTIFIRPLPGLAVLAAALAPGVGRRRGRLTSIALRLLIEPLAAVTRHGDRLVGWLLRGVWADRAR
jgi:hypothetical protein